MASLDRVDALRRDGERIAAAAAGHLDRLVPSCPGWNLAELVWHVGNVHTFWRLVAGGSVSGPDSYREPVRPHDPALVDWFRVGLAETVAVLTCTDPATPAWTWGRRKDVGFIRRRLAQETAVHCWDAVTAAGSEEPVEAALAADGVDEFVGDVLPAMSPDLTGPAQTIGLSARDTGAHWLIRAGDGGCRVARAGSGADTGADAKVTATASDLLLLLWGRRGTDAVAVDGDAAALARFLARARF